MISSWRGQMDEFSIEHKHLREESRWSGKSLNRTEPSIRMINWWCVISLNGREVGEIFQPFCACTSNIKNHYSLPIVCCSQTWNLGSRKSENRKMARFAFIYVGVSWRKTVADLRITVMGDQFPGLFIQRN